VLNVDAINVGVTRVDTINVDVTRVDATNIETTNVDVKGATSVDRTTTTQVGAGAFGWIYLLLLGGLTLFIRRLKCV